MLHYTPRATADWKAHTAGGLDKEHKIWFWEVVEEMTEEDRARLLCFTCGSARIPAEGFKRLNPPFRVDLTGSSPSTLLLIICSGLMGVLS